MWSMEWPEGRRTGLLKTSLFYTWVQESLLLGENRDPFTDSTFKTLCLCIYKPDLWAYEGSILKLSLLPPLFYFPPPTRWPFPVLLS